MRLFSRIFFILSLLSVLCALSSYSIYAAACSGPGYTCRKFDCAVNEIEDTSRYCTNYDYICCKKVPTSTPKPTNTPEYQGASPTNTPAPAPTTAGLECPPSNLEGCRDATEWCMSKKCNCKCTSSGLTNCDPGCSSHCTNNRCYVTHVTPGQDKGCNNWGPWSGCMSGQDACGGCASQSYTCQVRYCNDSSSNAYQISCGCSQPPGGGNPTNTPAPTPTPNPYWLKPKDISFRGLSSIPWSSVLSHSLCVFVPSW